MSIDYKDINEWEVLTPNGWQSFSGIKKVNKSIYVKLIFKSKNILVCSVGHKLKRIDNVFVDTKKIKRGTKIIGKNNNIEIVKEKILVNNNIDLYDLIEVSNGHEYYSNNILSSNCAFIENVEEIWLSSQYTLSTGGRAIVLSTPNGVGNFFHKTWVEAEEGKNDFKTIRLPWHLHPERDQSWRDKQTELSGVKGAAQECDCSFATSGNQVVGADILEFYKQTYIKDPIEKRGTHQDLWIWDYPNYSKNYMVIADCARGDGGDYSAFHVIEIESLEQVAEYKGQLSTKDFGNLLVAVSTEYNNALLVVENNNQGWAVLQQVIDRNYPNTFYSASDLTIVDVERTYTNKLNRQDKKLIPGFSTTTKTRPLVISTLELFIRQKHVIIKSNRLLEELNVFIWNGSKAEAMKGYNDDLVMSLGIGLWVRETALKLRNEQIEYNRAMVSKITRKDSSIGITKDVRAHSPIDNHLKNWEFNAGGVQGGLNGGKKESLTWLL
jgi:hypothetical protein